MNGGHERNRIQQAGSRVVKTWSSTTHKQADYDFVCSGINFSRLMHTKS